jgi:hypothetical protein
MFGGGRYIYTVESKELAFAEQYKVSEQLAIAQQATLSNGLTCGVNATTTVLPDAYCAYYAPSCLRHARETMPHVFPFRPGILLSVACAACRPLPSSCTPTGFCMGMVSCAPRRQQATRWGNADQGCSE